MDLHKTQNQVEFLFDTQSFQQKRYTSLKTVLRYLDSLITFFFCSADNEVQTTPFSLCEVWKC